MLSGLRNMEGGAFVAQFHGQLSQYIREDDEGGLPHHFSRGRGEQGGAGALLSGTTQSTCCCAGDPAAHRMSDGLP